MIRYIWIEVNPIPCRHRDLVVHHLLSAVSAPGVLTMRRGALEGIGIEPLEIESDQLSAKADAPPDERARAFAPRFGDDNPGVVVRADNRQSAS